MSTVTHRQAQRLAALGYPPDRFPQMVWEQCTGAAIAQMLGKTPRGPEYALRYVTTPYVPARRASGRPEAWYAAPVYVSGDRQSGVFDWLEHKYGVQWSRNRPSLWRSDKDEWVVVIWQDGRLDGHAEKVIGRDTASDVLDAILDQLEAAQLTAKEGV